MPQIPSEETSICPQDSPPPPPSFLELMAFLPHALLSPQNHQWPPGAQRRQPNCRARVPPPGHAYCWPDPQALLRLASLLLVKHTWRFPCPQCSCPFSSPFFRAPFSQEAFGVTPTGNVPSAICNRQPAPQTQLSA